jgi:hypothetical protein
MVSRVREARGVTDPLAAARGVLVGVLLGALCWAIVLLAIIRP